MNLHAHSQAFWVLCNRGNRHAAGTASNAAGKLIDIPFWNRALVTKPDFLFVVHNLQPNDSDQPRGPSEEGFFDAGKSPEDGRLPALRWGDFHEKASRGKCIKWFTILGDWVGASCSRVVRLPYAL
jgi:hypothetical protein